jgi:RNA polymerase sigma-70 factor, ECF subfamily
LSTEAERIDRLFRRESAQAVASLARVFDDLDRAEEAVQDAYVRALTRWPRDGVPPNPGGWILLTARNAAIDRIRRERVGDEKVAALARLDALGPLEDYDDERAIDDRLGMIFVACHHALALDTRIALTLRFAAGLGVAEIATALLSTPGTIAQRLTRAKHKIRTSKISFAVPKPPEFADRLDDVLRILYLIFNEGYASATHQSRVRGELCEEALRLVTLLERLLPGEPEILGLHALMLFHHARREGRTDEAGDIVLLEHQDRSRWDAVAIAKGRQLLERIADAPPGPYGLQARVAMEHACAVSWSETDWSAILAHYDALATIDPSPVVALNRAVALAFAVGPAAGLDALDAVAARDALSGYAPLAVARAEMLSRLGLIDEARVEYARALAQNRPDAERRLIERRASAIRPSHS